MFQRYGFCPPWKYERPDGAELEADVAVAAEERKARGLEALGPVVALVGRMRRFRAMQRTLRRTHGRGDLLRLGSGSGARRRRGRRRRRGSRCSRRRGRGWW